MRNPLLLYVRTNVIIPTTVVVSIFFSCIRYEIQNRNTEQEKNQGQQLFTTAGPTVTLVVAFLVRILFAE